MDCLRCGKKTAEKQSFCEECLAVMEKYPVKPGTAIHLLHRPAAHAEKKQPQRHREPTAAEQVEHLRGMFRWLFGIIAVLSVLLLLTAGILLHEISKETPTGTIGKNYTTVGTGTQP